MSGMYEPFRLLSDTYPGVVPKVKAQGLMALMIGISILWALVWLTYRAYQVCLTPNEVLVDKLGLDIPPTPDVTLEEISSRKICIAWKYPEFQNSIHKHVIRVNGVRAGESKRTETAVSILNLTPGHIYHVCVTAVSAANFQTSSAVLHIRTLPSFTESQDGDACGGPVIQAYVPKPASLNSPSVPVMAREHSSGTPQGKRSSGVRRPQTASPTGQENPPQTGGESRRGSVDESEEALAQLADRLKSLQQENENLDKQICQEEKEHEVTLKELEEQRNDLKQRVKEKDEASGDLRKHVSKLESVNRTVQGEKNKRERLLQQKEAGRQKRKEDIARWEGKMEDMKEEMAKVHGEKDRVEEKAAKRMEEYRAKISNEQTEMKSLDEDIQVKGSRIKQLEDERRGDDNEEEKEFERLERERERLWEIKLTNLRAQYASLISVHAQAQQQYFEAQERFKWVNAHRSTTALPYTTLPGLDSDAPRRTSQSGRHRGSLPGKLSSPGTFPLGDASFVNANNYNQVGNGSPTFPPSSAFFNINNGMTIPDPNDQSNTLRMDSGNPPMSPRADALLPSDLLGDEEPPPTSRPSSNQFPSLEASAAPFDSLLPASRSPESSKSIFASPRESLHNVREEEDTSSQDPTSLSEAPADGTQSTSRRLSGFFGFNRQRGKTVADGPPLLGSLKPGQSQSFPRNDQDLDPVGTRRRRLSYAGGWANPMMTLFPRSNNTNTVTGDSSSDSLPASRKAMFPNLFTSGKFESTESGSLEKPPAGPSGTGAGYNQFSPRHDPIDPSILGTVRRDSSSPRPSSTYSFDNYLPRPLADNPPFGWAATDKTAPRNSPLGVDWSSPANWSRSQSRRPSFQMGSSNHLPLGLPVTDADSRERPYEPPRPVQAPIGTRPPSAHRPVTPKLNPAAPSFKTLFGKKPEKPKDKENDTSKPHNHDSHKLDDSSPPVSRHSKDSRSIPTSAAESHESLDRVASSTPSENVNAKESFIQKITRKGSSGKFNMPWKDRSGLFSKKSDTASQGDIDEDGTSEIHLGKSLDSTASSTPSADKLNKNSLSFNFMRKSKKDKAASEGSERASETGDEDTLEV